MADLDHYEIYYADKLWNLIPVIYRSLDSNTFGQNGPLREMVNRIGAQAAVVRRSIDRLWQDQSIETCDDWVIPYIADLLSTNLISSLDARGQRLDVANTIYYRRRKGTVGILEEIAHDITGWDARVVEFFRRLGRTRHNFDPAIGLPSETDDPLGNRTLQLAEGLIGQWTGTPMGGWADLRNAYGASQAQSPFGIDPAAKPPSAFDEYFHTADFRAGQGRSGWYNIPKLGIFLWRLQSFRVDFTTPVKAGSNSPCYTFDPTGREIPLFAFPVRSVNMNWLEWVSPQEWQLPTPISTPLLTVALANPDTEALYASLQPDGVTINLNALGVFTQPSADSLIPSNQVTAFPQPPNTTPEIMIYPEKGKFRAISPLNSAFVTYCYGFPSTIGAGPYDRRVLGQALARPPAPVKPVSGGSGLDTTLAGVAPTGTVQINDSLTYIAVKDVNNIESVTVMAQNPGRPVIRLAPSSPVAEWAFSGNDNTSSLVLEGLLVSGGDVVLKGVFGTVTLRCCTFDPGTAVDTAGKLAKAIDGRELIPCHLWIEAEIEHLIIDRCILGPIATRKNGEIIKTLAANDSIIQALGKDLAINLSDGQVQLSRCSILGKANAHRLYASECILDDVFNIDDTQDGCVRFTAWSTGSVLPRQYESVQIAPGAPLFTSRNFGQPGYCQLQESADNAIIPPVPPVPRGASISTGAQNGSEMGAFARDKNPIKQRGLLIKYQEFMPLGLVPVVINVT